MSSRRKLSFSNSDSSLQLREQCELCNGSDTKFTRPQQWRNESACSIATSLLIAPACRRDIGRVGSDPDFTPRWEKVKGKRGECECTAEVFASNKSISIEMFQSALAETGLNAADNINNPIPLCKHHYFMLYHYSSPTQTNCVSCKVSLKRINARSCPNPSEIEQHLRDKTGFEGNIN